MENSPPQPSDTSGLKIVVGMLWLVSLVAIGGFGYVLGHGNKPPENKTSTNVLAATQSANTPTPLTTASPTPQIVNPNTCEKSGLAQKWEYLTSYTIKEGDSIQSIVETELKDESRLNEVLQLNGTNQLVVGSILYLPPKIVTKSTGNLKQVHGKLIEKNASVWHVSFNGDKEGMGILIPSFWFGEIKDKDTYKVGDCLTVLLDDGFKVFSVELQ